MPPSPKLIFSWLLPHLAIQRAMCLLRHLEGNRFFFKKRPRFVPVFKIVFAVTVQPGEQIFATLFLDFFCHSFKDDVVIRVVSSGVYFSVWQLKGSSQAVAVINWFIYNATIGH